MYLASIHASIICSICCCYIGYSQQLITDGEYCDQYSMSRVLFMSGYIAVSFSGQKSGFTITRTTYIVDNKTGFITIDTSALRENAYKSYPFVKHLWSLTYDEVKDQVLVNHPKANEPISLTKGYCKRPIRGTNYLRHVLESGNFTKRLFCSSVDQAREGVIAHISFGFLGIPIKPSLDAPGWYLNVYENYTLYDGPSEELKLVWSETINNRTTVDALPFIEFSTMIYYNTKADVLNVSSTSSKDFWIFKPKTPWGQFGLCP